LRTTLSLTFTLDGVPIGNGDAVEVRVFADSQEQLDTTVLMGAAIGGAIVLVAATIFVMNRSKVEIVLEEETVLTPSERVVKTCNDKIVAQKGWLTVELADVLSDVQKGVVALIWMGRDGSGGAMLVAFEILSVFSLYAGYKAIVTRIRCIDKMKKIRDADPKLMEQYRKAGVTDLGPDSVHLKWEMVCLELQTARLAVSNAWVEDLPSIVLNLVDVYLKGQKEDFAADLQLCLTALPIILSCVTSGRKSSLPVKIRELQATKAKCEERMKNEAGGRRPSIVNGLVTFGADADGKSSSSHSKNSSSRVQPVFDGGEEDIARTQASTEGVIGSVKQQRQPQEKDDDGDDDHANASKSFMKNDDSREAESTDENVAVIK
jgi:hypothetical protein